MMDFPQPYVTRVMQENPLGVFLGFFGVGYFVAMYRER